MKKILLIILSVFFLVINVSGAAGDVYEVLSFTNYTYEELHVELFVFDNCCTHIYDLYVWPHGTSIAYFWAGTINATYSACAYGEISGDLYGCIEGGVGDYYNNLYFDDYGEPYLSTPSDLPAEVFVFSNPYDRDHVEVVKSDSHYHAGVGCFIGTISY